MGVARSREKPRNVGSVATKRYSGWAAQEKQVYKAAPEILVLAQLAKGFFHVVRERDLASLPSWFEAARTTALAGFANRLAKDQDAVEAALTLPWSQGQVEGQVHRLKLIKRQMYGHAGFDLLRLRVLQKA